MDRNLLETVIAEMNEVMEIQPPLLVQGTDEELLAVIKIAATGEGDELLALHQSDFENSSGEVIFSEVARKFFIEIGVWDNAQGKIIIPKKEEKQVETQQSLQKEEKDSKGEKEENEENPIKSKSEDKRKMAVKKKEKKNAVKKETTKKKATKKDKKVTAKKDAVKKTATVTKTDEFGLRVNTSNAKVASLLKEGKYTMSDIKKKMGATYYNLLKTLSKKGHTITKTKEGKLVLKSK